MDSKRNKNKVIFDMARRHLLQSSPEVTDSIIDDHLKQWKEGKRSSIDALLFGMLNSIRNRRGMSETIKTQDIEKLRLDFKKFNPRQITDGYGSNWREDWEKVFGTLKHHFTPERLTIDGKPKKSWVIFCKSVISAANYLSRFSNIEEFNTFVEQFYPNEYTRIGLPLLLDKEIFGLGFALACDFLKENGYPEFVKPDTQIKAIFQGIGLSQQKASDYEVFWDVIRFAQSINEKPYEVDKLFWLVGSGNFYLIEELDKNKYREIKRKVSAKRDVFIEKIKKEVGFQGT